MDLLGSGNVGWHLAHALYMAGYSIPIIINRGSKRGQQLADLVDASYSTQINNIDSKDLDLLILAVNDDEIRRVTLELKGIEIPLVHTSGGH